MSWTEANCTEYIFPHMEGPSSQKMQSHTGNNIKNAAMFIPSIQSLTVIVLLNEYDITKSNEMCQGIYDVWKDK